MAQQALGFAFGFFTNDDLPQDAKYYSQLTKAPYASVAACNAELVGLRYQGLTVRIGSADYWYDGGIADGDLVVKTGATAAAIGIQSQTVSIVSDAITNPSAGKIKLVKLNVSGDQQYSGLPTPTNSGIIYILKLTQLGRAWFTEAIDGIGPGAPGDPDENDTVILSDMGSRIMIVDLGTYEAI